jgi:hypothetical protein
MPGFLICFLLAASAYGFAVLRLQHDQPSLWVVWIFALLFRSILLATRPDLSDDIYRYLWDGHLLNQGISPYAYPVNDANLNPYAIPIRELVNHSWMASPYLPVAQLLFGIITRIFSQSIFVFQATAATLDLAAGWLVMAILKRLALPQSGVLIYLWNPLVIIEFASSAHVDAWMIFLTLLAMWCAARAIPNARSQLGWHLASAASLAAATLTKVLPALLAPLFLRRWGWKSMLFYILVIILFLGFFAASPGWGLSGSLDGKGLFGALRIYAAYWNYNGSLYHWLEVLLTGYKTPGAVPVTPVTETAIRVARLTSASLTLITLMVVVIWAWRLDDPSRADPPTRTLALLQLAVLPISAYILFTPTLHPWYTTFILPFLPFLLPRQDEQRPVKRFLWPWVYFSCAVAFSYLTYLDPQKPREFFAVRLIEYLPFYLMLAWAGWPFLASSLRT